MPSKRQVSLTLSAAADRAVKKKMKTSAGNKSRVVSQMIERYTGLLRRHDQIIGDDGLEFIRRLTEGWTLDFSTAMALTSIVQDADVPDDLDVRKSILLERLHAMHLVGWLWVIEKVEAMGGSDG